MSLKILHLVVDDKFIDDAIDLFDTMKEFESSYWIVSDRSMAFFNYIKNKDKVKIVDSYTFLRKINNEFLFDVIVLHGLNSLPTELIIEINSNIKLVWFSWGYDIYSNLWPEKKMIKLQRVKSKDFIIRNYRVLNYSYFKYLIKNNFKLLMKRECFFKAIHRIDYYSGVFPEEYELIKQRNPIFRAKKISFNYPYREDICEESDNEDNWILVGNSSSYLLNHCDVFNRLKRCKEISKRVIFVPLSYGDKGLYLRNVLKKGRRMFGSMFHPIIEYIPYSEYKNMIKKCSVAIFNVEQQASVGNICICLSLGIKVFLPINSMGYKFFKKIGAIVYSIENDLFFEIDKKISSSDKKNNKDVVMAYFSFDNVRKRVIESFNLIEKDIKNGL